MAFPCFLRSLTHCSAFFSLSPSHPTILQLFPSSPSVFLSNPFSQQTSACIVQRLVPPRSPFCAPGQSARFFPLFSSISRHPFLRPVCPPNSTASSLRLVLLPRGWSLLIASPGVVKDALRPRVSEKLRAAGLVSHLSPSCLLGSPFKAPHSPVSIGPSGRGCGSPFSTSPASRSFLSDCSADIRCCDALRPLRPVALFCADRPVFSSTSFLCHHGACRPCLPFLLPASCLCCLLSPLSSSVPVLTNCNSRNLGKPSKSPACCRRHRSPRAPDSCTLWMGRAAAASGSAPV